MISDLKIKFPLEPRDHPGSLGAPTLTSGAPLIYREKTTNKCPFNTSMCIGTLFYTLKTQSNVNYFLPGAIARPDSFPSEVHQLQEVKRDKGGLWNEI